MLLRPAARCTRVGPWLARARGSPLPRPPGLRAMGLRGFASVDPQHVQHPHQQQGPAASGTHGQATAAAVAHPIGRHAAAPPTPQAPPSPLPPPAHTITDRAMLATLAQHLWPSGPDSGGLKARVAASLALLLASKLLTIQVRAKACARAPACPRAHCCGSVAHHRFAGPSNGPIGSGGPSGRGGGVARS
jgi:hypothetical protein